MLNMLQPANSVAPLCNGLRRREFLQIGSMALGGGFQTDEMIKQRHGIAGEAPEQTRPGTQER